MSGVAQSWTRLKRLSSSSSRDIFKKIRGTKGTSHVKMDTIKDRNGMDIIEANDTKKRWQEYTEELYKKKIFMIHMATMLRSLTQNQTLWNVMSSGP